MDSSAFFSHKIEDRSYTSIAKREIQRVVREAGFTGKKSGEIDIIVAELATNLLKHADHGGELLFRICGEENKKCFELFCIDNGPGTNDINRMLKDGMSSVNTLGQGLGAISRLSDFFQIYSMRNWGTIVYCKKYMKEPSLKPDPDKVPLQIKTLEVCIPGERMCGDGCFVKTSPQETQIFVGDGLGHGPHAYDAVQEAISAFKACELNRPIEILKFIHERVKKTRGLVGTIAILNHEEKKWRIAGVGNISTRLYKGLEYKNYLPYNGILGLNMLNSMSDSESDADKFQTIVMTSDGIKTKWDLSKYTSILKYDPAVIAACIFKDHARRTDDMTVLVGKLNF